jgi:hypothetical protein
MRAGKGFSRFHPAGDEPLSVLVARAAMALNALRAIDPHEAESVARAFLSGALTPKPKEGNILPWKRS